MPPFAIAATPVLSRYSRKNARPTATAELRKNANGNYQLIKIETDKVILLSSLIRFEILKRLLLNTGDLILALWRLLYFTILLVTLPANEKLSEKERLILCPVKEVNTLPNSDSVQLITSGKLLNCFGFVPLWEKPDVVLRHTSNTNA